MLPPLQYAARRVSKQPLSAQQRGGVLGICRGGSSGLRSPQKTVHAHAPVSAGCLHPDHVGFFDSPGAYLKWYERSGPVTDAGAPTVAVLLYRKHVITQQLYIEQLVRILEAKGIRPIPIFINGALPMSQFTHSHLCM